MSPFAVKSSNPPGVLLDSLKIALVFSLLAVARCRGDLISLD